MRLVTVLLTKTLISQNVLHDLNQAVPKTLHASVFRKIATLIRPYNMFND